MSFLEVGVILAVVVGLGVLSWWIADRLTSPPRGPTPEQRRKVAHNFMRGAQLMGRCGKTKDGDWEQRPVTAGSAVSRPTKQDLKAAIDCFNEGLRAYPNDFSSRFLKAQALEDLGEFNDALVELDWLLSQRSSVKPNLVRKVAIAVGVVEARSVAPLGTTLVNKCEVDLVVFHLRKRKGRILLRKRRVREALLELKLAVNILDKLTWDEETVRRGERANARMKCMKRQGDLSPGKENQEIVSPRGGGGRTASTKSASTESAEEMRRLLEQNLDGSGDSAQCTGDEKPAASSGFKISVARADINVLLARCYEEIGNITEAVKLLDEASVIGNEKTKEEAQVALRRLEQSAKNIDKSE